MGDSRGDGVRGGWRKVRRRGERRVYHEIEGMTKLHAVKNHFSLVQLSTVYLCSLANSHKVTHTHKRRTTDSVVCQNQPTVCLLCCQSSKATCGCQSVLCGMHGLAGNAKTAMVSTAVIIMTLEMKKFDAELKIKRPKHSILTKRNATNFLSVKQLQDITRSEYI